MEDGAARPPLLSGRRLPERSGLLRRADELEDQKRRRQAGGARHRRLGRPRAPRRLSGAAAAAAGRDAAAARRRGGRGGAPRAPRNAVFDSFCWGIEPWDAKTVEAELKKRGLTPVADNHGKDFQSFHVKDPDGFDLQISNGNRKNRRRARPTARPSAPAPFESTNWKTRLARSHLVRGLELQGDRRRSTTRCSAGSSGTTRAARTSARSATSATSSSAAAAAAIAAPRRAPAAADAPRRIGHISFGITPFDPDQVKAELDEARPDRARGYRRPRRHPHLAVQELSHDDAERIRPADQRHDADDARRLTPFFRFDGARDAQLSEPARSIGSKRALLSDHQNRKRARERPAAAAPRPPPGGGGARGRARRSS